MRALTRDGMPADAALHAAIAEHPAMASLAVVHCVGPRMKALHDALPKAPLHAMVPVSIRTGEEEDPWTNRVSSIFAELPTDCDDPVERVARCRQAMADAGGTELQLHADSSSDHL